MLEPNFVATKYVPLQTMNEYDIEHDTDIAPRSGEFDE